MGRAFKFPQSPFVLFKGSVNVCLDSCLGVQCSNGQRGFGRRRRREVDEAADPNKVYEISMSTVIKMKYVEKETISHIREKVEFRHTEEAALSALFNEFGSARFVNYESSKSSTHLPLLPLILAITAVLAMLR